VKLWRRVYQEKRVVVLPLLVFLLANVGAFFLGVLPLRRSVTTAADDKINADIKLGLAKRAELATRTAGTSKDTADAELAKFYDQILPADFSSATNLISFWVESTARSSGVQYKAIETAPAPIRDSKLTRVTGKFTLQGTYANIRRFLYAVETTQDFLVVDRVELAQPGTQQTSTTIEVALTISTFYRPKAEPRAE
jgi:hypothetical protein